MDTQPQQVMPVPIKSAEVFSGEAFGQPIDFLVEQVRDGDTITIKVTTVLPHLVRDGNGLRSFPPPRYPWPNVST